MPKTKEQLSDLEQSVCFQKGTEAPFTGKYWDHHEEGVYQCKVCDQDLFSSENKFDSGTGWPSFYEVISKEGVATVKDLSHGMTRVEVTCSRCGSHLGHVFLDGPRPSGLRYCINSASLNFSNKKS